MNPTRPVVLPSNQISLAGLRDLERAVKQVREITVARPLELITIGGQPTIRDPRLPSIWVRITGKEASTDESGSAASGSGAEYPESHYSGIQQRTTRDTEASEDDDNGRAFWVDGIFLKEISGNPDVPDDEIVRAYPSEGGDYYTFKYSEGYRSDESGSGDSCETTNEVTFEYQDVNCCTRRVTITFPFAVTVCDEPSESGCSGGA